MIECKYGVIMTMKLMVPIYRIIIAGLLMVLGAFIVFIKNRDRILMLDPLLIQITLMVLIFGWVLIGAGSRPFGSLIIGTGLAAIIYVLLGFIWFRETNSFSDGALPANIELTAEESRRQSRIYEEGIPDLLTWPIRAIEEFP